MVSISTERAALICQLLNSALEGKPYMLSVVHEDGSVTTFGPMSPGAQHDIVRYLAEHWAPDSVDNIRVPEV